MEQHYYPPPAFHFRVTFHIPPAGKVEGNDIYFQTVSGLEATVDTEMIKEGGLNNYVHELPIRVKYGDLTLKRGLLHKNSAVMTWLKNALQMKFVPSSIQIMLLNEDHKTMVTWNVVHAWPKKWSFSDMDAEKSTIMVETMEIRYNYFTIT